MFVNSKGLSYGVSPLHKRVFFVHGANVERMPTSDV